ncbi:ras and Rab interactor 3-like protein, partial [Lates japonicus]
MMEDSDVSQDTGHTSPLTGALDTPPDTIPSSSPLSPPSLPSHLPARPCRPKPLPPAVKSSQLPSRPPLPPSTPPSLPPPAPLVSKPPTLSNHPPPSLPPPLSPIPVSPPVLSPQSAACSDLAPSFTPCSLPPPLSPTVSSSPSSPPPQPPPVIPPVSPAPPLLSPIDRLIGSSSVWQPKGLSQDQTSSIMEKETAGTFLVHNTEDKGITLSVRMPDEQGEQLIHSLMVKQHKTFVHLDGSSLVFDDIFKLISFYCASRDILTIPLRLPLAITTATKREELEVISAMGADFWTSDLNQKAKNQNLVLDKNHSSLYLYVNPVTVEESPNKDLNHSSISKLDMITNQNTTSSLQNGEGPQKVSPEDKVKKPSRPVPPPRRKPGSPGISVCPNQAGGLVNQSAGMRVPPPSSARRPDVSLYSPQGGAVLATDPDSCSTSSTEEEGELSQEQEQNNHRPAESRSPKAAVRRTSTTVMLDRARYRLSTVLTGLISHDRRLTQRIVELARDPLSYFGNLVKEHRAFTLETMSNHSSSTELLQEIRQMMTQLKSYLLQSTELQAMLEPQHQYVQDKLENIAEAALCKSVLKPLREPIYQSLEKLHINDGSMKQLTQNQSVVLGSTTTALGVTTAVPEASAMEKISIKLNNLHLEYSPQKKIELLLKACKIIYDSMSISCP